MQRFENYGKECRIEIEVKIGDVQNSKPIESFWPVLERLLPEVYSQIEVVAISATEEPCGAKEGTEQHVRHLSVGFAVDFRFEDEAFVDPFRIPTCWKSMLHGR